ncbi:MAG: hypothetical protein WC966_05335 [Bradymonadales bacterium]
MHKSDEFEKMISMQPESFELHRRYALYLYELENYSRCFDILHEAMYLYEENPASSSQGDYFVLRRIEQNLRRMHMRELIGDVHFLLAMGWQPVFKRGLVRELVLQLNETNVRYLVTGLQHPKLRKLRGLSLRFQNSAMDVLPILANLSFSPIRALQLHFSENILCSHVAQFVRNIRQSLANLKLFYLQMPRIVDDSAIAIKKMLADIPYFTLHSQERSGMTHRTAYFIADDAASESLEELALVGTQIGDRGLLALAMSKHLTKLSRLSLKDGVLSNNAARILTADHELRGIGSLDLSYNEIDEAGIASLQKLNIKQELGHQHQRPAGAIQ